ncbi:MAG: rRNA maturation RNase YbeY [Bacilli bacterium]|nr:rRNA maturation RNase YbeY [Bacilli bacterium]
MNQYEIFNEYDYKEDYRYLDEVIEYTLKKQNISNAYLSVIFIDDDKMHEMNKEYRGIDRTTDVLSFAYEDNENIIGEVRELGDIFISIPKMKSQALEYGHSEKRELSFLVVHGILHLLGFDHTIDLEHEKAQFSLQDEILNELNITR